METLTLFFCLHMLFVLCLSLIRFSGLLECSLLLLFFVLPTIYTLWFRNESKNDRWDYYDGFPLWVNVVAIGVVLTDLFLILFYGRIIFREYIENMVYLWRTVFWGFMVFNGLITFLYLLITRYRVHQYVKNKQRIEE